MTLPPIDAVRYYEWIGRDIEGKENILVWLGDVQQIYRSHAAYNRLVVELARQLGCRLVDLRASFLENEQRLGEIRGAVFVVFAKGQCYNVFRFAERAHGSESGKRARLRQEFCRAATKKRAAGHEPDGRRNIL